MLAGALPTGQKNAKHLGDLCLSIAGRGRHHRATAASPARVVSFRNMNTQKTVTWLVTCSTLLYPDTFEEKETTYTELIDGPEDIKLAETQALRHHVPLAFEAEPEGRWITMNGLRAFKYNNNHSEMEDGNVFWIHDMRVVEPADVPVMKKYLAFPPPAVRTQRRWQQLRLRGDAEMAAEEETRETRR